MLAKGMAQKRTSLLGQARKIQAKAPRGFWSGEDPRQMQHCCCLCSAPALSWEHTLLTKISNSSPSPAGATPGEFQGWGQQRAFVLCKGAG